ncbi:hypothetical protein ACK8P5_00640 [Paenibacillus sp. EC2-1]|uniref:hypothetical protein n=1 Tax=Paenibacillus sp. EC2-1 TaxID=3388665 RepID=UPI003BEEF6D7
MDAESLNDIQSMVRIGDEIRKLRSSILMIDPLEVSEPIKRKMDKRKRPRLPA